MSNNPIKVNVSVCGKFHYLNYISLIAQAGILNGFYYSHKVNSGVPGVDIGKVHNYPLKEYLTFFHLKFLRGYRFQDWILKYQDLWQRQVLRNWSDCSIFHTLNHGASIEVCKMAKSKGSLIIGEPVNSHPENMFKLLNEEHARLGLPYNHKMPSTLLRMMEEAKSFDYYLSPSSFVTKSFVRKGVPEGKIFTIPFGVDIKEFRFKDYRKDKFRVIYVAHVTPRKAHIDLLEAWVKLNLPSEQAELIFVGGIDPVMNAILLKYRKYFTYKGTMSREKLVECYNSSSVFVMPSVEEGCSYAPLEAMACGLPVILTENTGSSELISHGKEGFIVPIRSPEMIAHYLELLYTNNAVRTEMSRLALQKSVQDLSWSSYAEEILGVYNKMSSLVAY